jgi:DNA-binding response OmpR family regulator
MKLNLNVIGHTSTYGQVKAALASAFLPSGTSLLRRAGIETSIHYSASLAAVEAAVTGPSSLKATPDLTAPDSFQIVVVNAEDTALLAQLAELHQNFDLNVPVIAITSRAANLQAMARYCRVVDDWIFDDFSPSELAFRLLAAVSSCERTVHRLPCGDIILARENRTLSLNGRSVRLSPSEVSLAEFFLNKSGQLITLSELVAFFECTGKSSAMNNIRVAIYQLRLKIEELSNYQLTVVTVYRQGYALRPARASAAFRAQSPADAVEEMA